MVGNQTRVKVVKNKMAPPFRQVEFDIMYGEGISKTGEIVDLGVQAGFVEKSGAWFSAEGERIGQGRENAKVYLREHPEMMAVLENKIKGNSGIVAEALLVGPDSADPVEAAMGGEAATPEEDDAPPPARGKGKKGATATE